MADSSNILSILASLGAGAPAPDPGITPTTFSALPQPGNAPLSNVLQDLSNAPPVIPQAAPDLNQVDQTAAAPIATADAPRKRQSALDVIGRLADVFATVGGAQALYQPTLDAREDRTLSLGDHARQVDLDALKKTLTQQEVSAGALQPELDARKRLGTALGALANNPNAADLWPSIAAQAGITDPQKVAAIGQALQQNPGAAGIFAKALGADTDNLGKNVYFGADANGKTVAYQVGPDGQPHILDFSASGVTPSEPLKVVDLGGSTAVVGANGAPKRILPKTARPDTLVTTNTQRDIAAGHDRTNIAIAGMPARATTGTGKGGSGSPTEALSYLDHIDQGFDALHKMGALPGDSGGLGAVEGAIGRTGIGQKVGEQMGSAPAQKRLELIKNISSLQTEMIQSLPGSATRTKFEQEIQKARLPDPMKMSYTTAKTVIAQLRAQYQRALANLAVEQKAKAPKATAPNAGGWSVVKVQ